jgi:hypothetical protein
MAINWTHFLLAVLASGFATWLTDWLFMGVLFHDKYLATPEIWRLKPGESETNLILASTVVGVLSCAAFIYLCIWSGALSLTGALRLAVIAWLAAPVPVIFSNAIWTKMHPLIGVSHGLGWLVRFLVTALVAAWLL